MKLHLVKTGIKPMLDEAEKDAPFEKGGVLVGKEDEK